MPARNIVRTDEPISYYHVYARGVGKGAIFLDDQDKYYFIQLLSRYLSITPQENESGRLYPNYSGVVELLAYCLMDNHFHLLIYQDQVGYMSKLMTSIMTSYSMYFNLRYKRTGALFETRYRASRISSQNYLEHISRYIHLNPRNWATYEYSSIRYYLYGEKSDWLATEKIKNLFTSAKDYMTFLSDYEGHKYMLEILKSELAHE